jgi:hypothetical protein
MMPAVLAKHSRNLQRLLKQMPLLQRPDAPHAVRKRKLLQEIAGKQRKPKQEYRRHRKQFLMVCRIPQIPPLFPVQTSRQTMPQMK